MHDERKESVHSNVIESTCSVESRADKRGFSKLRQGLRFSLKALLILTTLLCFGIATISNQAIKNQKAIEFLESSEVGGVVTAYRELWFARLTPGWLRDGIGKDYFREAESITLVIWWSDSKLGRSGSATRGSSNAEQAIQSLSQFKRINRLDLKLRQLEFNSAASARLERLDFSALMDLEVYQLSLDSNNRFATEVVSRMKVTILDIHGCEMAGSLAKSTIADPHIRELKFQQAKVEADVLLQFKEMKSLESINFHECRPVVNRVGTFDVLSDPFTAPGAKPWKGLGGRAMEWLELNIPGISITGPGPFKSK